MEHLFDKGVTPGKFTRFVVPSVIMFIVIGLYYIIDAVFVANFVGMDALASMSIAYPIQGIVWGLSVMLAAGASPIVAMRMGEGNREEANEKFTLICLVAIAAGIILIALGLFFIDDILRFLGATDTLMSLCHDYASILIFAIPAALLGTLFEYFIRVDGRPGFTLFLYLSGGIVHILLDYLFIVVMNIGIRGAALASAGGMTVVLLIGGAYFLFCKTTLRFKRPKWDLKFVGHCVVNGSSEMVTESSAGITTFFFNMVMLRMIGENGVAAMSVVLNSHYLLISTHLGYIAGVTPLISYYYGARDYAKVTVFLRYSRNFIVVSSVSLAVLCYFFAPHIAAIFESPGSEVYELAQRGVMFLSGAFLFTGVNVFASGFFTAYGNGPISALISLSRALIMVLVGLFTLSAAFGVDGVFMTLAFADMLTMGLSFYLFKRYQQRYHYGLTLPVEGKSGGSSAKDNKE